MKGKTFWMVSYDCKKATLSNNSELRERMESLRQRQIIDPTNQLEHK